MTNTEYTKEIEEFLANNSFVDEFLPGSGYDGEGVETERELIDYDDNGASLWAEFVESRGTELESPEYEQVHQEFFEKWLSMIELAREAAEE